MNMNSNGYIPRPIDTSDVVLSDELLALAEELKERSDFASGVEIRPGDRLVTLSTCAYAFKDARYIAVGRLRSVWTAEEM